MAKKNPLMEYLKDVSPEQRQAICSAGGKKAQEKAAAKKAERHTISAALQMLMDGDYLTQAQRDALIARNVQDINGATAIALAMYDKAVMTGDSAAARFVAEYTDGKPADKVQISGLDGKPIEAIDLTKLTDAQLQELIAKRS